MPTPDIRPTRADDIPGLQQGLDASGLFPGEMLPGLLAGALRGVPSEVWLTALSGTTPGGFCYAAPEPMTDGTWNMRALAVRPADQGTGVGRALVAALEDLLRARQERLVIVATSGQAGFAAARRSTPAPDEKATDGGPSHGRRPILMRRWPGSRPPSDPDAAVALLDRKPAQDGVVLLQVRAPDELGRAGPPDPVIAVLRAHRAFGVDIRRPPAGRVETRPIPVRGLFGDLEGADPFAGHRVALAFAGLVQRR
mgnify:CR=1 FL=1